MPKIVFGLGSNLGNRELHLQQAVEALVLELSLANLKKSQIINTKALLKVGAPQEWDLDFLNMAISGDIDLQRFSAEKILEIVKNIEEKIGRKASDSGIEWAPREIDIDILAIDDLRINLPNKLQIPHHALFERDFFLQSFGEIESDLLQKLAVR